MAKKRNAWMIRPARNPKAIPAPLKNDVEAKARVLIEKVLRPRHVKPPQENERFNHVIDIGTKWYRSYFYFFSTHACPAPNAPSPTFESKFSRMEYLGKGTFALYFRRHTGERVGLYNERDWAAAEVVYFANDHCNQENLIEQLKNGVRGLRLPSNTLEANWAYMVIGALAWSFKVWLALVQPKAAQRQTLLSMEFKQFLQVWLTLPCQILHSGRQFVFRLVSYNRWVGVLLRTVDLLRDLRLT
jgi:hypothetical protein